MERNLRIYKVYEIQNIGKGVITDITRENLLPIYERVDFPEPINQDNFVRNLRIDLIDLVPEQNREPTLSELNDYIYNINDEDKTIEDDDSKWNIDVYFRGDNGNETRYLYELVDIGKGIIPNLTRDNINRLVTYTRRPTFQDVLNAGDDITEDNDIIFSEDASFVLTTNYPNRPYFFFANREADTINSNLFIGVFDASGGSLGKGLKFLSNKTTFIDTVSNKGLEYEGNYESNFTDKSLVTKQYVLSVLPTVDGSETKLTNGITTLISGIGTTNSPYKVETVNLQKSINSSYLVKASDNNYSIKVNNGSVPITITIPIGLPENFFIGITQRGTGDITLVGDIGVTLSNPIGLKIAGQGLYVGVEQIGNSNTFDVLANTKA